MKDVVLELLENILIVYFYILFARFVLDFVHENLKEQPISQLIYKLTKPVLDPLHKTIPHQHIGNLKLDIALLLLILFYNKLIDLVVYLLSIILV